MGGTAIVVQWSLAFTLTLAVEVPVIAILARPMEPRLGRRIAAAGFANLASHPIVWFVVPAFGLPWILTTAISESWACVIEAGLFLILVPPGHGRAIARMTIVANAASFSTGLALWWLGEVFL